jgi:hypothetical protein
MLLDLDDLLGALAYQVIFVAMNLFNLTPKPGR